MAGPAEDNLMGNGKMVELTCLTVLPATNQPDLAVSEKALTILYIRGYKSIKTKVEGRKIPIGHSSIHQMKATNGMGN